MGILIGLIVLGLFVVALIATISIYMAIPFALAVVICLVWYGSIVIRDKLQATKLSAEAKFFIKISKTSYRNNEELVRIANSFGFATNDKEEIRNIYEKGRIDVMQAQEAYLLNKLKGPDRCKLLSKYYTYCGYFFDSKTYREDHLGYTPYAHIGLQGAYESFDLAREKGAANGEKYTIDRPYGSSDEFFKLNPPYCGRWVTIREFEKYKAL